MVQRLIRSALSPSVVLVTLTLAVLPALAPVTTGARAADVRSPAVAGSFYPGHAGKLKAAVQACLADALPLQPERPLALIAPHAGYVYSGQICADAYRQAADHDYDLVVILGTNHRTPGFKGVSIYDGAGYRTPLGVVQIDQPVSAALRRADERFTFEPAVHKEEHSVEVQVPFVQTVFPELKIVAAVIGQPDDDLCERFGRTLAEVLAYRRPLIVASSDLSHYPDHEDAVAADSAVLTAIAALDPPAVRVAIEDQLRRDRPNLSTCACGQGPIMSAIIAAKSLGATRASVISYANSGDTALGDHSRVVGYGAVALTVGERASDTSALEPPPVAPKYAALQPDDRKTLLSFARQTIQRYFTTDTAPLARGFVPVLNRHQGAFVTLNKNGALRGCIGHMAEDMPLCQVVGAMALQAAFNDRRFSALQWDELPEIEIEISVLTPFSAVPGPEAIVLGRDGVVLRKDGRSAVYLPQVAVEQGWDHQQMLDHLCRKAGLPAGSWRDDAKLFTFQAEVFHEGEIAQQR